MGTRKPQKRTSTKSAMTPAEKEAANERRQQAIEKAHEQLMEMVGSITSSQEWKAYLAFGARFHRYSFSNQILLWAQQIERGMQPLTRVGGFGLWRELQHPVRKGEKALKIFAPLRTVIREGEPGYEPGTRRERIRGFTLASVFDVQQVSDPDSVPQDPTQALALGKITGDVAEQMPASLQAMIQANGYTLRFEPIPGGAEGLTDPATKSIVIDSQYEHTARAAAIIFHEIAHMLLHTGTDEDGRPAYDYAEHRGTAEVEAEGTAYVVACHFGIDMGATSAGYVAGWSQKNPDALITSGTRIMDTARRIIAHVEGTLTADEQDASSADDVPPAPEEAMTGQP
ncbi:ssDNA-binding domain-containing protein [Kineosporia rhizophila]|uniref:ArdC-like ssDNA-binding domain-containing protein n=1 Tax=Kineosporia rhizophila TaxID=84633 RepID=UPI001E576A36|nr:ArdC-like ssDNA-binding domain-containing protein [Kineosporia rhizophila]MCE0540409.1 ssDNA-binding domain-containing protein [Kineosporia rhizophila]